MGQNLYYTNEWIGMKGDVEGDSKDFSCYQHELGGDEVARLIVHHQNANYKGWISSVSNFTMSCPSRCTHCPT